MNEEQSVSMYETLEEEPNVARPCWRCQGQDMLVRDPTDLQTGSIFSWCPDCGMTYTAARSQFQ